MDQFRDTSRFTLFPHNLVHLKIKTQLMKVLTVDAISRVSEVYIYPKIILFYLYLLPLRATLKIPLALYFCSQAKHKKSIQIAKTNIPGTTGLILSKKVSLFCKYS